ncbi:MAG: cell division protein FtsL [Deltaproteobacteria bacterium]|nr:cell division protein FtsL [Deltaproteobacteria bacterium]
MARGATSILHHAKSVRRQPTFSPLDKSRRVFLFAFVSLVVLASACAIFYIGTHIQAVNLGYKIGQELQRKEQLIEENKRLSLEIARLKSPTRIEAEAKEALGLELPKTQQVFYLSRWEPNTLTQVAGAAPDFKNPEAKEPAKKPAPAKALAAAAPQAKPKSATKTAALAPASTEKKSPAAEKKPAEPKAKAPEGTKVAAKTDKAAPKPAAAKKPATLAKKSEPARPEGAKPETKASAAKSSAKPAPQDTRVARREGSEVLVAKIVSKESTREKSAVKPRGAAASTYQSKDKVPAVMLDPMP